MVQNTINYENGFELSFNMKMTDDKCRYLEVKHCFFDIWGWCLWQ